MITQLLKNLNTLQKYIYKYHINEDGKIYEFEF